MKKNTISSITAILVMVLVGFVPHEARALDVTTNDRHWLEEKEFSQDGSLHATLDQVIIFDLEPAEARDRPQKWHKKGWDKYRKDHDEDRGKYENGREKNYAKYQKKHVKDDDRSQKGQRRNHGKHHKRKLYLGDHELKWNSVRFLLPDAIDVSFCIPEDEPYIAALELETADGDTVLWSRPGDDCTVLELQPDRYRLHILHDPLGLDGQVKKVFLHRPQQTRLLGGSSQSTATVPDFMAFKGPNGQFVTADDSGPNPVQPAATSVDLKSVWRFSVIDENPLGIFYQIRNGDNFRISYDLTSIKFPNPPAETRLFIDPSNGQGDLDLLEVQLADQGSGNFTINTFTINADTWPTQGLSGLAPAVVESDNTLHYGYDLQSNPTTFTADYKGYNCGNSCDQLILQEGEIAVFAECNYAGPAIVFVDSRVEQLSIYNGAAAKGLAMGNDMISSIRVGFNTLAILYENGEFNQLGGVSQIVTQDTPCLDGTRLGSKRTSSLLIENTRNYVALTHECVNCNLTGIDLSDLDLTGGGFPGTTFTGANLTNTILKQARLGKAIFSGFTTLLSGTDFTDAIMEETDLRGADLTNTIFKGAGLTSATFAGASTKLVGTDFTNTVMLCTNLSGTDLTEAVFGSGLVLETNFGCRLNLAQATLNIDAIPFSDWRYLDLTGAMIVDTTGTSPLTLSTLENPTDLSGAVLSGVNIMDSTGTISGLSGVILDGADMSCATPTATNKNCTQLIDTDLSKASLVEANLADAAMNGANLIQANLEMADLSGAQLLKSPDQIDSAKLDGAYLKNANLSLADLSGASLLHVNWYSTSPKNCPGSTWMGTCASGEGTTLSNAKLEGAYLNGLDLSNAILQGANLDETLLVGVNFTDAKLGPDPATGGSTSLSGAFLQGANFTDADATGANFLNGYVDLDSTNGVSLVFQLPVDNLNFTGYWKDPSDPECVLFTYSAQTMVPTNTVNSNTCPDGRSGSCTDTQWRSPSTPIDEAQPPSSSNFPTQSAGACTAFSDIDFDW